MNSISSRAISSAGKASPNPSVEAIDKAMKQRIGEIRTGMPGEIISFDAGTCMATVKPSLQYHTADGDILDYPLIIGVPVFMPHAGNAQITYPVKVGDSCWIAFAERSLDEWLGKSDSDNHDPRQYDLTDAVCFVGMRKVQSISADNVEIINGPTSISLTPDQKINIVGDVNIKGNIICSGTSKMSGNITCDGDVIASGISLTDHTHGGVETGGGNTSGPQ